MNRYARSERLRDLEFAASIDVKKVPRYLQLLPKSKAQLRQDLFVLVETNFKKNGWFVEFGATDGVKLSNTFLLESEFGWNGVLAEPARNWHSALRKNRTCNIESKCVWKNSDDQLLFNEIESGEFSTIAAFSGVGPHADIRKYAKNIL